MLQKLKNPANPCECTQVYIYHILNNNEITRCFSDNSSNLNYI